MIFTKFLLLKWKIHYIKQFKTQIPSWIDLVKGWNKEVYTRTMLMVVHQKIAKLFDEEFWVTQWRSQEKENCKSKEWKKEETGSNCEYCCYYPYENRFSRYLPFRSLWRPLWYTILPNHWISPLFFRRRSICLGRIIRRYCRWIFIRQRLKLINMAFFCDWLWNFLLL